MARDLSTAEIERLIDAFAVAASNVKMAGFDAIELHGDEGYLMDQFMTAKGRTNMEAIWKVGCVFPWTLWQRSEGCWDPTSL